tara:strand:+ start:599 stop:745 length:147 start_codon:yes stop_codon:yes gene_type:complete
LKTLGTGASRFLDALIESTDLSGLVELRLFAALPIPDYGLVLVLVLVL